MNAKCREYAKPYAKPIIWEVSIIMKILTHSIQFKTFKIRGRGYIEIYEKFIAKNPKLAANHNFMITPVKNGICMVYKTFGSSFIKDNYEEISIIENFAFSQSA